MKTLKIILLALIVLGCSPKNHNDEIVEIFRESFGETNSDILDEIVDCSEKLLMKSYSVETPKEAYRLFLTELRDTNIENLEIGLTETEIQNFVKLFEKNNLKNEIWSFSEINGIEVFDFDYEKKFIKAYEKLMEKDKVARDFYETHKTAGGISYSLLAGGILESEVNLDDYLAKRMIVVDILYRYATLKLL